VVTEHSAPVNYYIEHKIHLPKVAFLNFSNWPKEIEFDMENFFNNFKLIKLVIKWRVHLLIVLLLSVSLSILFSCPWFIKPKYKSYAVLYPSNLQPYSNETSTELMLQLFNSDDIRDTLIKKFNLAEHYDIDISNKYYYTQLIRKFESNVNIRKTEYESVIIEILDTDPITACDMVNEMVNLFNKKARKLQKDKSEEVLAIAKDQLDIKQVQLDTLKRKLDELRKDYGILDYTIQTKEASKAYYKSLGGGKNSTLIPGTVSAMIENLQTKGGDFIYLSSLYYAATDAYNKLKENYENALKDVTKQLTYTNYVSSPVPSDKKTYPVRWLIVLVSTVASMILALIVIMLLENIRNKKNVSESPSA
jgi:capsule polysaccharide export protein KpsE/RkpR